MKENWMIDPRRRRRRLDLLSKQVDDDRVGDDDRAGDGDRAEG